METLDQSGLLLYDSYIKARDAWISYIRPYAITKLNNYLSNTGRKYYKYEFYTNTTNGFMKNKLTNTKPKSPDMVAKYKKLCILFHPDKFNHPQNTDLFCLLKKWFDVSNGNMLDILDRISHLVLEMPSIPIPTDNLANMLTNLANPDILDIIKSKCRDIEDARCIYDVLNTDSNKLGSSSIIKNNCNDCNKPENFINTNTYIFFMDEANTKSSIDEQTLTEAELIDYIKAQGQYDDAFLAFCYERYRDNENILWAIVELQLQRRDELKKENEILRERLNRLSKTD